MADTLTIRRVEDFASLYANNIRYETSAWDLKLIFGQLDQGDGPDKSFIEQHTAMSMAWPTARIMAYFLTANCAMQEFQNGAIQIPASVLPPRPDFSAEAWSSADKAMVDYLGWVHDQFFGKSAYVAPIEDDPNSSAPPSA